MRWRKRLRRALRGRPAPDPGDDAALLAALRANVNRTGSPLANLLHSFRVYRHFAEPAGITLEGARVLEIGSSPEPGLALIYLLEGAEHYVANNILPLSRSLARAHVELLLTVAAASGRLDPARVDALVRFEGERVVLREERLTLVAPVAAEDVALPAQSFDLIHSNSVLEHVRRPEAVLRTSFELLRPGGFAVHGIDLRDHQDFARPLEFLRWTEAEYTERTGAPENRLRASDWLERFAAAGFELVSARFTDRGFALDATGVTDVARMALAPVDALFPRRSLAEVEPWVEHSMRDGFDAAFRGRSLEDLSVLVMHVVCRRPG